MTIGTVLRGDTITQASTGSTATVLFPNPSSTATVAGTLGVTLCNGTVTMTQASTGITGTEVFPTPNNSGPVPLSMVNLSGTADSSHIWTGGTTGCQFTPSATHFLCHLDARDHAGYRLALTGRTVGQMERQAECLFPPVHLWPRRTGLRTSSSAWR